MDTGVTAAVELPVVALAELIESAGVGEPHLVLRPVPVWRTPEEAATLPGAVSDALADAGLLRRDGRVDQHLLDLLPLLTTPVTEYFGWFSAGGTTHGVLAAAGPMDALLAVRTDDVVRLTPATRTGLLDAMLGALPAVPPGRGSTLTVTADEIAELHAPADVSERRVPPHVTDMMRLVNQPVRDGGEVYAGHRDTLGRHTVNGPVRYADTDRGRYLNYTIGTEHTFRMVLAPAYPEAFTEAFEKVGPLARQSAG